MNNYDFRNDKLQEARFWIGAAKAAIWDDPKYEQFKDHGKEGKKETP